MSNFYRAFVSLAEVCLPDYPSYGRSRPLDFGRPSRLRLPYSGNGQRRWFTGYFVSCVELNGRLNIPKRSKGLEVWLELIDLNNH
jgi:hypothetical protein